MSGFELDQEETLVQQNTLAQQEKPAEVAGLKIALGIEYNGSRYLVGNGSKRLPACRPVLRRHYPKWLMNPLGSSALAVPMQGSMLPGKLCTLLPLQYVKTPPGLWGSTAICPRISQCVGSKPSITIFMPALAQRPAAIAISFLATAIALRYWRKGSPIAICHWMQKNGTRRAMFTRRK